MATKQDPLKTRARALFSDAKLLREIDAKIDKHNAAKKKAAKKKTGKRATATTRSLATLGLANVLYNKLGVGSFTGLPTVQWNGMDSFMFLQDKAQPFAYTTSLGRVITPKDMPTDGGSIPQVLRGIAKLSSWGYAPGYMIHDWIFIAHKCARKPDDNFTFAESATVLAEAIKTLMEVGFIDYEGKLQKLQKAEDTLWLIYIAVSSLVAKKLWNNPGTVRCELVGK